MRNKRVSSKVRARICSPIGNPAALKPQGMLIPGRPAKLHGRVNTSIKYIASGSFTFSPSLNAVTGEVGEMIASTLSKTRAKSWRSEEHTSELQSRQYLVCRLLLEKKKRQ